MSYADAVERVATPPLPLPPPQHRADYDLLPTLAEVRERSLGGCTVEEEQSAEDWSLGGRHQPLLPLYK
jgi:hypothetical protein